MTLTIPEFVKKWQGSAGDERANKDQFLLDLLDALGLPKPGPKDTSPDYCFEKDLHLTNPDGSTTTGFMDLYLAGSFVLEAKQGGKPGSPNARGTRSHDRYMERAFGQAARYVRELPKRPPFLITCDIGHVFEVWEGFGGDFGGYARRKTFTMANLLKDDAQTLFKTIWEDPQSLDPARRRARVTRAVAETLGELAKALEKRFPGEAIARFLMRCVFTFFAEDAGLLPENEFQKALEGWRKSPADFIPDLENLWDTMNHGGKWGRHKILHFNGGLFSENRALALDARDIEFLFQASKFNWVDVDPSIFGTLLESALNPAERHRLGAHYTPRAYVERLLKPALEDPLRADWELAQAEAFSHLSEIPTEAEKAKAREVLHGFQHTLAHMTVLDPACGSGNFLAAAYDIFKKIEGEIQRRLEDLGETARALALENVLVTPKQFMGIEVKPWAAAIADMVLWIGHLQWHRRLHPGHTPPEPVLQAYGNIECRDAVLTWKGKKKTTRTRWDGKTTKTHPATGREVPDETAQIPIEELVNPKPAKWPKADFIIGNPPFLGNARMREALGDGYTEALRAAYPDVPDTVDFVLYWWHRAAETVRNGQAQRFGLITTNSLRQVRQRCVIQHHQDTMPPLKLIFAIPDHPWHDEGAAVRIAMTVGTSSQDTAIPWLGAVEHEGPGLTPEMEAAAVVVGGRAVDCIHSDLSTGADVSTAQVLKANDGLSSPGMKLHGAGFIVSPEQWAIWGRPAVVHPYRNGKDMTDQPRNVMVIDLYGYSETQVRAIFPSVYQHILERVKPERDQNNDIVTKRKWWIFGRNREDIRPAMEGLSRYIAVPHIAKHHAFEFLDGSIIPDNMVIVFASSDAYCLGILLSKIHRAWFLASGGTLENRPIYYKTRCFDPFPFPDASGPKNAQIRSIAEALDAHRKAAQARGVTITAMYNILVKLRAGEALNEKEKALHKEAQTSILLHYHDDLDAAVAEAYGWPVDLSDSDILERLVTLNRERAEEEKRGLVRWLRPEYQAKGRIAVEVPALIPMEEEEAPLAPIANASPWPTDRRAQFAALRDILLSGARLWSLEDLAACFKSRGRYRDSIKAHLDVLEDLGLVHRLEGAGLTRWHRPTVAVG